MILNPSNHSLRSRFTPHQDARFAPVPSGTPKRLPGDPE